MELVKRTVSDDGRPMYRFPFDYSYVIPGDIHFPLHNPIALKRFTLDLAPVGKKILFLQGDFGDQEAFNKFAKDPDKIVKTNSMRREKECLREWIERWRDYDFIAIGPGNHGIRAYKSLLGNPGFVGLGWWWPYGDLFQSQRIIILDADYRAEIGPGILIEHGDSLKGASDSTKAGAAAAVASAVADGKTHIFGHTHRAGIAYHTRWPSGKRVVTKAVNVGHCIDVKKIDYVKGPNWQLGCGYVYGDDVLLEVM